MDEIKEILVCILKNQLMMMKHGGPTYGRDATSNAYEEIDDRILESLMLLGKVAPPE